MKNFRDVFHYDKLLLGRNIISGNVSSNIGRVVLSQDPPVRTTYRNAIGIFTRIRFFEEFSLNTTFYKDFNGNIFAPWISDFTYSIGRFTWRPNKFSYGYENYINNKYSDSRNTLWQKFLQGNYFIAYSHFLPPVIMNKIKIDSTSLLRMTYFIRYAITYMDKFNQVHGDRDIFNGKPSWGIAGRYNIIGNFYIESAVYFYVYPSQKQPWDPDFTYGFGYFDWRSFRISFTYGNWAINRFPWNKKDFKHHGFLDGNFRIVANYIW